MATIVTTATLKDKGYPISALKNEAQINLAEKTVINNYFPGDETFEAEEVIDLLHALTFSLLLKHKIVSTRFGTEEKKSQHGDPQEAEKIKAEIRVYCRYPLEKYLNGLGSDFDPPDLLEIYDQMFLI